METTSETIAPTQTLGRMERLQNDGARIFSRHGTLEAGQAFYADVKGRLVRFGRVPDDLVILPGATFVLGEVIDHSTIDSLTRAQRSGDPAKRAEAARLARDAVAQRLDQLKKKRAQIEARARQLRSKH